MPEATTTGAPRGTGKVLLPRRTTTLHPVAGLRVLARGKTWSHWPCVISGVVEEDGSRVEVQFMDDGKRALVETEDCLDFNALEIARVLHYASTRPKLRRKVARLRRAVDIAMGEERPKGNAEKKNERTSSKRSRAEEGQQQQPHNSQHGGNRLRCAQENDGTESHSVQDKSDSLPLNDDGSETFATSATDAVDHNGTAAQEVSTVLYSFPVKKRRKPLSWMAEFLK